MNTSNLMTYLLPILTALLLLLFFVNLPHPGRCELPRIDRRRLKRPAREDRSRRLSRRDLLPILLITLLYALTAFFRLGVNTAPQTFVSMTRRTVEFTLPEGAFPSRTLVYAGPGYGGYDVDWSEDGEHYATVSTFTHDHIAAFKWTELESRTGLEHPRYVRISCTYGEPWLGEVVLLDGDGQPIPVQSSMPKLVDEQDTVPARSSFLNSSYFDEIYHARTAWEHLHDVQPYETTHPPLGKEIIGLGIRLFGMTPFGWRFSGTLFGVLMLPALYVFLKRLFGGRAIPSLGTLLFATDFMHYVQTRIATIDVYAVFFILLMYLFLYIWLEDGKLWALALCGLSFGLGAASKWTCLYAGAGLGLLWAAHWVLRFLEARKAPAAAAAGETDASPAASPASPQGGGVSEADGRGSPDGKGSVPSRRTPSDRYSRGSHAAPPKPRKEHKARRPLPPLAREFLLNVGFCLVFFVLIPVLIYYLSYIPYGRVQGAALFTRDYWDLVVNNQVSMFTYHSESVLGATHPYSSRWYQWLVDARPILYVLEYPDSASKVSIAAFLNPVLCWGGLLSLPVLGWMAIGRRDKRAAFLLVGYLSQLVPWLGVERLTFAYHYFPSALFLALSLSYVLALLRENKKDWKRPAVALVIGSGLLLLLFFPALNGLPVRRDLATALMKWLPSWPL